MSAKELRDTIPGYSQIRWGQPKRDDCREDDPLNDPVFDIVLPHRRGKPDWMMDIEFQKSVKSRNSYNGRMTSDGWKSMAMNILVRDIRMCARRNIPFKSTNVELKVTENTDLHQLFCKGLYIGQMDAKGKIHSFVIPVEYDKFQLYLLRYLNVRVYRKGRGIIWDKKSGEVNVVKGRAYHIQHEGFKFRKSGRLEWIIPTAEVPSPPPPIREYQAPVPRIHPSDDELESFINRPNNPELRRRVAESVRGMLNSRRQNVFQDTGILGPQGWYLGESEAPEITTTITIPHPIEYINVTLTLPNQGDDNA